MQGPLVLGSRSIAPAAPAIVTAQGGGLPSTFKARIQMLLFRFEQIKDILFKDLLEEFLEMQLDCKLCH